MLGANRRAHAHYVWVPTGQWDNNKRVGEFKVIDSKGVKWNEIYGADGKRTNRRKVHSTTFVFVQCETR